MNYTESDHIHLQMAGRMENRKEMDMKAISGIQIHQCDYWYFKCLYIYLFVCFCINKGSLRACLWVVSYLRKSSSGRVEVGMPSAGQLSR